MRTFMKKFCAVACVVAMLFTSVQMPKFTAQAAVTGSAIELNEHEAELECSSRSSFV